MKIPHLLSGAVSFDRIKTGLGQKVRTSPFIDKLNNDPSAQRAFRMMVIVR
jgi:hypothetical protein